MMGQNVEHHQSILEATACRNLVAQHDLLAIIMHACVEEEGAWRATCSLTQHRVRRCATTARLEDGPTSETARDFLHVFLRVATINSEGVKFHQLARVVFVNPASLLLLRRTKWLRDRKSTRLNSSHSQSS